MKLKTIPEDFKVSEIPLKFDIKNSGKFKIYQLKKKSIDMFELLSRIAKLNKIPVGKIGYAGIKDKYAITYQYISVPDEYTIDIGRDYASQEVKFVKVGNSDDEIKRGDLKGNQFEITIRNIDPADIEEIRNRAMNLNMGVPNYFDSQRFGSSSGVDFIGRYAILGEFEKAVKMYLTNYSSVEDEDVKDMKDEILSNWDDLRDLKVRNKGFQMIIDSDDWHSAYLKIPQNLREMFVFSYQSYLWNRAVGEILVKYVNKKSLFEIQYKVGRLKFYRGLSENCLEQISKKFKTISIDIKPGSFEYEIYERILSQEGLTFDNLDIKTATRTYLVSSERNIILIPEKFKIKKIVPDEMNKNRQKMVFSFFLEKGSYATIVLKKLFDKLG